MPTISSGLRRQVEDRDAAGDDREVRRAGRAVDERDAVQQERRGERAEQEVLERALGRAFAAAVDAGERVHRDRHQLDAEEDDHEVARRGEQHHARRREQDEHVRLGRRDARCACCRPCSSAIAKIGAEQDDDVDQPAEVVDRDRPGAGVVSPSPVEHEQHRDAGTGRCSAMPTLRWCASLSGRQAAQTSRIIAPPMSTRSGTSASVSCDGIGQIERGDHGAPPARRAAASSSRRASTVRHEPLGRALHAARAPARDRRRAR